MRSIIIMLTIILTSQLIGIEVVTNDVHGTLGAEFSQKDSLGNSEYVIPGLSYEFEGAINDEFTLFLESELGFSLSKESFDGTSSDNFAKSLYFGLTSSMEYGVVKNITFALGLPFGYESFADAVEDAEFEDTTNLDLESGIDYSTMEEDIEGSSPWSSFETGYTVGILFSTGLYEKVGDEDIAEEHDMAIGIELTYAYFNEENLFMIKPTLTFTKHLNDKVSEAIELETGVTCNKDLGNKFSSGVEFMMLGAKENSDADFVNGFGLNLSLLYYPLDGLELAFNLGMDKNDMSDSDEKNNFRIGIGADYEIFAK